ncbi:type II secretion system protein GspL [Stutzerimonas tarimensis]|uniref:Type II secretion system protein L n=1 Tax=Stutzerimonas tarimensis TaxID=1507735 RepID=A0ABV7T8Z0_9GAMM
MDMLFLPPDTPNPLDGQTRVYWQPGEGTGSWQALAECASDAPVALVLPAEVCSFFAVQLPTRKARWIDQALAYAVEELLAENVDELHLARGELMEDGRHRVVAIRRRLLADWLAQLQALELTIGAIHADADLLPRDGLQLLFLGNRGLLGGGPEARLAFAVANWPDLARGCPPPRQAHGSAAEAPEQVEEYHRLADPFRFLADGRVAALDLAQGEFAVGRDGDGLGRWKPVLALAAVLLAVQVALTLGQAWYFERQGDAFAESSRALYLELFPEDQRIVNLRAQFDQHLSLAATPSADFLRLLDQAANAVASGTPVTIQQLEYDEQGGALAMQVNAPDFSALEQFRQRLGETGQPVQLGSASRDGLGVSARVVIGG